MNGPRLQRWAPLTLVLVFAAVWTWQFYLRTDAPPFEDAAMLLRYASHVAEGHGIVWNVGEAPVDGATDFLFMMAVAGLARLGLPVTLAAGALTLVAHFLLLSLVFRLHVGHPQGATWTAVLSTLVVATGPGPLYSKALFGTTVFALAGVATYAYFMRLVEGGPSESAATGFATAGLVMGLVRPEGVILAAGMAATLIWYLQEGARRTTSRQFLLCFCLPGLAYFLWHWWYFGHPLPNPFYVKGGGRIYPSSLRASFIGLVKMGTVLLPVLAWAVWTSDTRRKCLVLLLPLMLFTLAWAFMSNAMNFNYRFQYVLMPILWIVWPAILGTARQGFALRRDWRAGAALLVAPVLVFQCFTYAMQPRMHRDGRADLGLALAPWKARGYSMAVTEAGNLPFFSQWHAVDTWGLNDAHIASRGLVDDAYLDADAPALVMIHEGSLTGTMGTSTSSEDAAWSAMTDRLVQYVNRRDYELVARWGREPRSTHAYYLRRDIEDRAALRMLMAGFSYMWFEDGLPATSFAP